MTARLPRFFVWADDLGNPSLLVEVKAVCPAFVRGHVVNGDWVGEFTETQVTVPGTERTFPGTVVWRSDRLPHGRDYNRTLAMIPALAVELLAEGPSGLFRL